MPIGVTCECGHEITVADSMEGKKGRCPKCDAVLTIPARAARKRRGGAFTKPPRDRAPTPHGGIAAFAVVLSVLGLVSLLAFASVGVYTGVTAFRGPDAFHGPFGLFRDYAASAREHPTWVGLGFIFGGLLVGGFSAIVLSAVGQCLRLFVSLERSLERIADRLTDEP